MKTSLVDSHQVHVLQRKLYILLIVCAWVAYVGVTGFNAWRIFSGDTPEFLKNYTLGTNALWVTVGVALWLVTEWLRETRA